MAYLMEIGIKENEVDKNIATLGFFQPCLMPYDMCS